MGINFGVGIALVVVAGLFAALLPQHPDGGGRATAVCAAVGLFAAITVDWLAVAGVAAVSWLVINGFLVNQLGEVSWHGSSDLYEIGSLMAFGAVGLAVGTARHQILERRARWRFEAQVEAIVADEEEEKRCAT